MINRRNTVKDEHVTVDVTHEEDGNEAEYELAEAEDAAGEADEDEPVYYDPADFSRGVQDALRERSRPENLVPRPPRPAVSDDDEIDAALQPYTLADLLAHVERRIGKVVAPKDIPPALKRRLDDINANVRPMTVSERLEDDTNKRLAAAQKPKMFDGNTGLSERMRENHAQAQTDETLAQMGNLDRISEHAQAIHTRIQDNGNSLLDPLTIQRQQGVLARQIAALADTLKARS